MAGTIQGIYIGRDEAWLLVRRDWIQGQIDLALQGKRFQAVASGGNSSSKLHLTLNELKTEMVEVIYALQKLNPTVYGRRIKKFYVDFSATANT